MAGLGDSLYSGNTRPEVYLRPCGLFAAPPALSSPSGAHSPFALPERLSQDMDRRAARLLESRRHAKESDRAIEPGARAANNHGQSQTQAPGAESPATGLIQAAIRRRVLEFETGRDCLRPAPRARWRDHSPWRGALTQGGEPRAGPCLAKGAPAARTGSGPRRARTRPEVRRRGRRGAGKLPAACFQSIANLLTPPFGR